MLKGRTREVHTHTYIHTHTYMYLGVYIGIFVLLKGLQCVDATRLVHSLGGRGGGCWLNVGWGGEGGGLVGE